MMTYCLSIDAVDELDSGGSAATAARAGERPDSDSDCSKTRKNSPVGAVTSLLMMRESCFSMDSQSLSLVMDWSSLDDRRKAVASRRAWKKVGG